MNTTLDIRNEYGLWADLRIVNDGETLALIHNPGNYRPTEGWVSSREAYRVAVLLSFHFLAMTLSGKDGVPIALRDIVTRANHDVDPPIKMLPHQALTLSIPLHEFYNLEYGASYSLEVIYGDNNLRVRGMRQFRYVDST